MIAFLLASARAADPPPLGSTAGLSGGITAVRLAARHAVEPALTGWVDLRARGGWVVGAELTNWSRRVHTSFYEHRTHDYGAAILLGWGVHRPYLAADVALGAGGSIQRGNLDGRSFVEPSGGLRLRSAFELRIDGPVVFRVATGALARDVYRWDFDVVGGLGVTW